MSDFKRNAFLYPLLEIILHIHNLIKYNKHCGYRMYACFFRMDSIGKIDITIGESSNRPMHPSVPISTHAEIDALQKLKFEYIKKQKRLYMNLLIVRISKSGLFGMSAPCYHCLCRLKEAKFVNIKDVYYCGENREIIRQKFSDMIPDKHGYVSSGYRSRSIRQSDK